MDTRITKERWAMGLAEITSLRSTCLRRNVGCVLFDKKWRVLSTGYNGVASGQPHCNYRDPNKDSKNPYPNVCSGAKSDSGTNLDSCLAIHAEQNALLQCKDVDNIHVCVTTVSPCMTCIKLLLNTPCQIILYLVDYPQPEAKKLWESAGRKWMKYLEIM